MSFRKRGCRDKVRESKCEAGGYFTNVESKMNEKERKRKRDLSRKCVEEQCNAIQQPWSWANLAVLCWGGRSRSSKL